MNKVALFISIILISFIPYGIAWLSNRENNKYLDNTTVRFPKFYLMIGIIGLVFFTTLACLIPKEQGFDFWVITILTVVPIIIIIAYFNFRIEIKEDGFVYQTFFRSKHAYTWEETKIVKNGSCFGCSCREKETTIRPECDRHR